MLKLLSVLAPLLALGIAAPVGAQQAPIKIGAILPLTGSGASNGVWMKGGAEMAAEEINAAGGIGGRKLEVIYEDHVADASKAVNGMRRLVEVEKVPFTLTSYSAPTLAIQPIGAQNKVVMMNGGGQSDNLAVASALGGSWGGRGLRMADYVRRPQATRANVDYAREQAASSWHRSCAQAFVPWDGDSYWVRSRCA